MKGQSRKASLAQDIAAVLQRRANSAACSNDDSPGKYLLMTGVALAVLQVQPANALALGELRVQSALGQPLVGTTTAHIGPGETIDSSCFIAAPVEGSSLQSPNDLLVTARSGAAPGSYPVQIRTKQPLYEPMYEIRLQVKCAGTVALTKSYVIMLNLPMAASPAQSPAQIVPPANAATASTAAPASPRTNARRQDAGARTTESERLGASRDQIQAGSKYRVRNGDTLSTIAERIAGRPRGSTWQVADMLYAANPRAFIRNNPDMIKLGWVLEIPALAELSGDSAAARNSTAATSPARDVFETAVADSSATNPVELGRPEDGASEDSISAETRALAEEMRRTLAANSAADSPATTSPFADEAYGNVAVPGLTGAGAALPDSTIDTSLDVRDQFSANSGTPAEPVELNDSLAETSPAAGAPTREGAKLHPLVAVAAGIGLGFFIALLLLGRGFLAQLFAGLARRKADGSSAAAAPAQPARSASDTQKLSVPRQDEDPNSYTRAGIDVEISSADADATQGEGVDIDLGESATEIQAGDTHSPRVSLHDHADLTSEFDDMLDTLAETEQFKVPGAGGQVRNGNAKAPQLESTDTMRRLFEEDAGDDPAAEASTAVMNPAVIGPTVEMQDFDQPTVEMPEMDAADVLTEDLQTLARLIENEDDDGMSQTLTQALDLLEQDYEKELSSSQIVSKKEVAEAFAAHKQKEKG